MAQAEHRFYKVKNSKRDFICALCKAPRQFAYSKNLTFKHYIQICVVSALLMWYFFPMMGVKSGVFFFIVWLGKEVINKLLYRREISCPYCGFDATWYRKDVNMARKKVTEFWQKQEEQNQEPPALEIETSAPLDEPAGPIEQRLE